jgi:small subunit ribosomal protein S6
MQHYELLYIIPAQYTNEEIDAVVEKIIKLIQENEGKIDLNEKLGKFRLSYPIKQSSQGNYVLAEFDAPASLVKKLNTDLKLMPEVLRHLITTKKKKSAEEIAKEEAIKEKILKRQTEAAKKEKEGAPSAKSKVSLEELDKKIDEILEGKIV